MKLKHHIDNLDYSRISAVLAVVALLVLAFIYTQTPIEQPIIHINTPIMFHGNVVQVAGNIEVKCDCDVRAWIDETPLEISPEGRFEGSFQQKTDDSDSGVFHLELETSGRGLNHSTLRSALDIDYNREETRCRVVDPPTSWAKETITFTVKCPPTSDRAGRTFTITKDFPIQFNLPEFEIPVDIEDDGYTPFSQTLTVTNSNYDEQRAKREERHWQELQEQEQYNKSPEGRRDRFLKTLRKLGIGSNVVSSVGQCRSKLSYTCDESVVEIYVTTDWQLSPYVLRRKSAQFFQQQWAAVGGGDSIRIVDEMGQLVGGASSDSAWVEKDE